VKTTAYPIIVGTREEKMAERIAANEFILQATRAAKKSSAKQASGEKGKQESHPGGEVAMRGLGFSKFMATTGGGGLARDRWSGYPVPSLNHESTWCRGTI
jgi:hypothetical protein